MWATDTGETQAVHLPNLSVKKMQEIDAACGKVKSESHAEGRVSMNILKNGLISVMEVMIRIFSK